MIVYGGDDGAGGGEPIRGGGGENLICCRPSEPCEQEQNGQTDTKQSWSI